MIPGINISRWQREINWSEVKRAGVKFAFIKATEFSNKSTHLCIDPQLEKNINGATINNVSWGSIHRFCTHIDPVLQAKVFCKAVGSCASLPPVVEIRESGTKGERLNYKVQLFVENVEEITGMKPILFTDESFWRGYMCEEKASHTDWARNYPLLLAQFTSLWPNALYPWAAWEFWQHTDRGKIPGIETDVNMIWFNGSEKELAEKYLLGLPSECDYLPNLSIEKKHYIMIAEQKIVDLLEKTENFKGDYQEPVENFFPGNSKVDDVQYSHTKIISENGGASREDEWIRDYFFQTA